MFYCGDTGVTPGEIDLADYTRSIERLNTSLGFLQTEMQRLAQQQEKIMAMREQQQQAWVIPPPAPSPHRYHLKWKQLSSSYCFQVVLLSVTEIDNMATASSVATEHLHDLVCFLFLPQAAP